MTSDEIKFALDKFITVFFAVRSPEEKPSKRSYLVELALAELDSKNAGVSFFILSLSCGHQLGGHAPRRS